MRAVFSSRLAWPAPDNALAVLRADLRARGVPILDFSESNPTRVGLGPAPETLRLLLNPSNLLYEPDPRGLRRAREAIVKDHVLQGRRPPRGQADHIDGRDVFLCASTSEAYGWLFKLLCDPGDAVLVPRPGYPLFEHLAGLEAVEARPYRLEYSHPTGWRIDLESVEAALRLGRTRALVVINPNNPTGSYVSRAERDCLVELCAKHGCAVIADEVFYDFSVETAADELPRNGHAPGQSSFIGEDRVLCFVLDGLSKRLGLPQMKLAWITASGPREELSEAEGRLEILADAYLSASAPIMNALPALLPSAADFVARCRRRLLENIAQLRLVLEGDDSPHRVLTCRGGWTAIIESPRLLSEEELAVSLLRDERLWTHPGYFFDMEREACFTAGLILEPDVLDRGARAYAAFFDRMMQ